MDFQDDNKENIEIIIEQVIHIPGLTILLICPQQVTKQTGHIGDGLHAENDDAHLIFGGLKSTKKYNANSRLLIYYSVNVIYKCKAYNMELHHNCGETDFLHWHNDLF